MKKAEIKFNENTAGWLTQDENGFHFIYDKISNFHINQKILSLGLGRPNVILLAQSFNIDHMRWNK